jgi:hypothetical protein
VKTQAPTLLDRQTGRRSQASAQGNILTIFPAHFELGIWCETHLEQSSGCGEKWLAALINQCFAAERSPKSSAPKGGD